MLFLQRNELKNGLNFNTAARLYLQLMGRDYAYLISFGKEQVLKVMFLNNHEYFKVKCMITELKDTPNTMVAFRATHDVTKEDFDKIVLPAVDELVQRTDKLNYLLVVDTQLKNFTIGAWMRDAMLGLNNINKWNRAAIVTDTEGIKSFTGIFSKVVPGEFRGFTHDELDEAINWVGEQGGFSNKQVFQKEGEMND